MNSVTLRKCYTLQCLPSRSTERYRLHSQPACTDRLSIDHQLQYAYAHRKVQHLPDPTELKKEAELYGALTTSALMMFWSVDDDSARYVRIHEIFLNG